MDLDSGYFSGDPVNKLPIRCKDCDFPDLDFVPQPYLVLRGVSMTPAEISAAAHGNLLVRPRLKHIFETIIPGQCKYYPTTYVKTSEETPWSLAVPVGFCHTGVVKKTIPRCSVCGEPLSAHPGAEYEKWEHMLDDTNSMPSELYKTANWSSSDLRRGGRKSWIDREVSMSLRLYRLLRTLKVAGIYEQTCHGETKPRKDEVAWVTEKMALAKNAGIALLPAGALSPEDKKWFEDYLGATGSKSPKSIDVGILETRHKIKFPKSYAEYAQSIGSKKYRDVDGQEGFDVTIHLPKDCDFANFRKGAIQSDDEESQSVNGVMFASTQHGDCFVFDVRRDRKEYEVFVYLHEMNCYEVYAGNFVECVKRFAAAKEAGKHSKNN